MTSIVVCAMRSIVPAVHMLPILVFGSKAFIGRPGRETAAAIGMPGCPAYFLAPVRRP